MNYNNITGFISIDYDEGKQSTYKGIKLHLKEYLNKEMDSNDSILSFNSGNPIVDFYALTKWLGNNELAHCSNSSSVDHFFMDSKKWLELPLLSFKDDFSDATIVSFDEYRERKPEDYWIEKTFLVCASKRWIGRTFADLKKYYYKKANKTNPLYV